MVKLHSGAATDVGLVRESNQDSWLASAPVFVVADGMGGHQGGEVASAIVVEEFGRLAREGYDATRAPAAVIDCLTECQRRIRDWSAAHQRPGETGWYAGTTVVVALLCEDTEGQKWLFANLGDSRIYKLHEQRLDRVSVDHSVVQELLDAGEIAESAAADHPERHVITRALGGPAVADPEFFLLPLTSASRVVLCSDGVHGMIPDARIEEILARVEDARDAAAALVAAAVDAGGKDNATAVVIDVVGLTETAAPSDDVRSGPVSLEEKLGALP